MIYIALVLGGATIGFTIAAMFSVDAYEKGYEDGRRSL
jgi:hypothetical protein